MVFGQRLNLGTAQKTVNFQGTDLGAYGQAGGLVLKIAAPNREVEPDHVMILCLLDRVNGVKATMWK